MTDKTGVVDTELTLCARLLSSLVHRIRGDLAVVTNDLAYLATVVDPRELERPRARCVNIAALLSTAKLSATSTIREASTYRQLADLLRISCPASVNSEGAILLNIEQITLAIRFLREVLGPWKGSLAFDCDGGASIACVLRFEQCMSIQECYSSLGGLAAAELGERSVVEGTLFDFIVRDHKWSVQFTSGGEEVVATILVPTDVVRV